MPSIRLGSALPDVRASSAARRGAARIWLQTRPECGHATNAICMVGRREHSRFVHGSTSLLDELRSDAGHGRLGDSDSDSPGRRPGLWWHQSRVLLFLRRSDRLGCGTKLPHNVSSMLGVMDGPLSDLRTGLPWQMVEIHEPVRLLFVIESTPERLRGIMQTNPPIARMIENHWVQLATLSPDNDEIHVYEQGEFHRYQPEVDSLPNVDNSVEWYRGWRDHLGFALVRPSLPTTNEKGR
ncbi:MAG: putative inorganic carbon transporter subunit DabA [Pirellulaceae bacterium]